VNGKYWLSQAFESDLLQLTTQTCPELDVLNVRGCMFSCSHCFWSGR